MIFYKILLKKSIGILIVFFIFIVNINQVFSSILKNQNLESKNKKTHKYLIRINKISTYPDPKKSEYADCLVTCLATIVKKNEKNLLFDDKKIVIIIEAFKNRKISKIQNLKKGSLILTKIISFDNADEKIKTTQLSDTVGDPSLDYFFSSEWTKTDGESYQNQNLHLNIEKINISKPEQNIKLAYTLNQNKIQDRISQHIKKIEDNVKKNKSWSKWYKKCKKLRKKFIKDVKKIGGIYYELNTFFFNPYILNNYEKPAENLNNFPAADTLISLNKILKTKNIHFIAIPFPRMEEITYKYKYPNLKITDDIICPERQRIILHLLKNNIDVIDVLPDLLKFKKHENPFYECCGDKHPANNAILASSEKIAHVLKLYGITPLKTNLRYFQTDFTMKEKYTNRDDRPFRKNKVYSATSINSTDFINMPENKSVVILGDSFLNVPKNYGVKFSGIYHHLSAKIGKRINYIFRPGGARQVFQILRLNKNKIKDVKVIIFVFSEIFFTEKIQWQPVKNPNVYESYDESNYEKSGLF